MVFRKPGAPAGAHPPQPWWHCEFMQGICLLTSPAAAQISPELPVCRDHHNGHSEQCPPMLLLSLSRPVSLAEELSEQEAPGPSGSCMQGSLFCWLAAWPSALAAPRTSPQRGRCQKHAIPGSCN